VLLSRPMGETMKVGLNLPVVDRQVTPQVLRELAQLADERGFAELYLGEHVVLFDEPIDEYPGSTQKTVPFPPNTPLPEPLVALAYLASATRRIRLATGIMILPQRNPIYTAKQVATLDWLSGGRLDVGIGVGWNRLEYAAVGVPWSRRGDRCDEYVDLLRALWRDDPTEHHGEFWDLATCHQYPKPLQEGGPPLWFGGSSDRALSRVAARGDGWYIFNTRPSWLSDRVAVLDRLLTAAGRTLDEVSVVVGTTGPSRPTSSELAEYADIGVSQVVVSLTSTGLEAQRVELEKISDELVV
jgi:probable F420-dependent oxidoreductase